MQKSTLKNHNPFKALLTPFAYIYQFITFSRNKLFDINLFKIRSLNKPVISIGNLTVGGTAKTPFTIFISKHLKNKLKRSMAHMFYLKLMRNILIASP